MKPREQGGIVIGPWFGAIDHQQAQIGISDRLPRFLDANSFRFVVRLADSRRVDKSEGNSAHLRTLRHQIARGARRRGDDGAVFVEEPIEEGKIFRREDFDRLLAEYYDLRGWDERGIPLST